MRERPILFTAPMVRSLLDDRKTMTRRVMKPQPSALVDLNGGFYPTDDNGDFIPQSKHYADGGHFLRGVASDFCSYGAIGDRLWVRETVWMYSNREEIAGYVADCGNRFEHYAHKVPSIHMPRWASRITLEITNVRVERLHEITEEDAEKEGVSFTQYTNANARLHFMELWDSIYGNKYPRSSNPWVWVIEFRKVK